MEVYTNLILDILKLGEIAIQHQSKVTSMDITVWDGIVIGGVGGAIAGVAVWLINLLTEKIKEIHHKKRIYNWLYNETKQKDAEKWRSTRAIASYNNLTEDRVRYICSIHEKIVLSVGEREDLWGIKEFTRTE